MLRLFWLIICVVLVVGLVAIRNLVSISRTMPEAIAAEVIEVTKPPLAKGDRLPSRFFDERRSSIAVETQKVIPIEPADKSEANDDVISWHWHEGSKVVRRLSSRGNPVITNHTPTRTRRPATPTR